MKNVLYEKKKKNKKQNYEIEGVLWNMKQKITQHALKIK